MIVTLVFLFTFPEVSSFTALFKPKSLFELAQYLEHSRKISALVSHQELVLMPFSPFVQRAITFILVMVAYVMIHLMPHRQAHTLFAECLLSVCKHQALISWFCSQAFCSRLS